MDFLTKVCIIKKKLKTGVFIFRLPRLHTQLITLSIDFEQNLSSLRFSFDTLIDRSNTEVLPPILIKYRKEHSAKNAIISYVQEIKLRRENLVARSLSACEHCKIDVHTVRIQIHLSRLKSLYVKRNT